MFSVFFGDPAHKSDDSAGINPTGQKGRDRDVADQMMADGVLEYLPELVDSFSTTGGGALGVGREG